MTERNRSQQFRLEKIKEINNSYIKEIDQNKLLSNKNKKVYTTLNYIKHFLTLVFAVTVCISISALASLVDISKGIMSYTIELNIFSIIAKIKKYKSIIKKKKKKRDEIALLAKTNLHCINGSISRSSTNSYIERDYFLIIYVLREYDHMKEDINNLKLHKLIKT